MTNGRYSWLLLLPLLAACSWVSDKPATIGTLPDRVKALPAPSVVDDTASRAIDSYRVYLQDAPQGDRRADATRRLADLQLEAEEPLVETSIPADGASHPAASAENTGEVVELYREFLETYPDNRHRDSVLYQLARAYEYDGDSETALQTLDHLVAQYPDSGHFAEAQFRRGEILFVARLYPASEHAYQAVLDAGQDSGFYEQALYKAGWARFKQRQYDRALQTHMRLLDYLLVERDKARAGIELSRADQEMLDDTLRVASLAFSYHSQPGAVPDYFARNGRRPYEDKVYASLGELYLNKERFTDAADTFQTFVDSNPLHGAAPLFQVRVIEAYQKGGFPSLVLESKRAFVERYELSSNYWQHHDPGQAPEVMKYLRANVLDLARHAHAQAQLSKKPDDYREAARWYRSFLGSFPDDRQAPDVNFMLAELLYESGDYGNAAHEYEKTAYGYLPHAKAAEAGYAALLAYRKQEAQLEGSSRAEWHRRGIDSTLRFAATFPQHPEATRVTARAAEELFALNELQLASQVALQVIDRPDADVTLQKTAWTVLAHSQFDLGDFQQSEAGYQQVLRLTPAEDNSRAALQDRLAASVYKQGESHRAQGNLPEAVADFLRVRDAVPGAAITATAEYDAAAGLIQLKKWDQAAMVLERFRKSYPDNKLQADITQKLAVVYLEAGQSGKAAAEFERVSEQPGGTPKLRREATWQAAELYEKAGRGTNAIAAFERYVKQFPEPVEPVVEAHQRVADLHKGTGNRQACERSLMAIVQADRAAGARGTERTRFLAAHASLELAEPAYATYRRIRLTVPLKASLAKKKREMESALKAYEAAIDYGLAEVTTAATYHIAEIYRDLAQALLESSRPGNLSPEELEQYDILLEEQAFPFEEKAIEIHEANLRRTVDGVYDEWVRKSLQQLENLMPVRYAKHENAPDFVETIN